MAGRQESNAYTAVRKRLMGQSNLPNMGTATTGNVTAPKASPPVAPLVAGTQAQNGGRPPGASPSVSGPTIVTDIATVGQVVMGQSIQFKVLSVADTEVTLGEPVVLPEKI